MNRNVLAVCDLEEEYVQNFVEYINEKRSIPFVVQAFTHPEKLIEFCREGHVEVLLISDSAMRDEIKIQNIGKIIILSQGGYNQGFEQYPNIYKYQSSDTVIREVMDCYGATKISTLPVTSSKRKTEIVGIYSPIGRAAKTSFALTYGQILARDRAVLYLNFEEYSGFEQLLDCKYERTVGDLIYYIRQGNSAISYKIRGMIQSVNNLDYLPPPLSPMDILDTSYEEWMMLLNEIVRNSDYETVICDFGDGVTDLYALLSECDRIYMPIRNDVLSMSKVGHFEHLLGLGNYEMLLKKIHKIKLPYHHVQRRGIAYMDELVWSEMGDFVRELTRKERSRNYQEQDDGFI